MARSFRMTPAQIIGVDAPTLRGKLLAETGSESGTDSILRSLERMGVDPTVDYFEMSEIASSQRYRDPSLNAWRVRADRGVVPEQP